MWTGVSGELHSSCFKGYQWECVGGALCVVIVWRDLSTLQSLLVHLSSREVIEIRCHMSCLLNIETCAAVRSARKPVNMRRHLSELWREMSTDNCEVAHLGVALHLHVCCVRGGVIAQLQMSCAERHMGVPAHFCDSSLSTFRVSHNLATWQLCD